jgi:hypothetical protein
MAGANDQILNILEKVGSFYLDSTNCFITESVKPLDYERSGVIFDGGRALLCTGGGYAEDRTFEYGILPFPKYDSTQEKYYSQVNPVYSSLSSIPITVMDTDFAGFGLEVLAEYSTDTTYEAYIETKCKLQDSFDQRMADMYDIIFENPVYDLVIIGDFAGFRSVMMTQIPEGKNAGRYSNLYGKKYEKAQDEIEKIMRDLGIA